MRQLVFNQIFHGIKYYMEEAIMDMIVSLSEKHLFREVGTFSQRIVVVLKVQTDFYLIFFLRFFSVRVCKLNNDTFFEYISLLNICFSLRCNSFPVICPLWFSG